MQTTPQRQHSERRHKDGKGKHHAERQRDHLITSSA